MSAAFSMCLIFIFNFVHIPVGVLHNSGHCGRQFLAQLRLFACVADRPHTRGFAPIICLPGQSAKPRPRDPRLTIPAGSNNPIAHHQFGLTTVLGMEGWGVGSGLVLTIRNTFCLTVQKCE